MSHPASHPEFQDNGAGLCWHCGKPEAAHTETAMSTTTEATERREPFLDGYGTQGEVLTYREGDPVEVLFEDGWRSGGVFRSYRAGGRDEDFHRVDVTFPATGRIADGCHPDCVRRPDSVGPFPAEPAFNSPAAVEQAAETIRAQHTPGPWRVAPASDYASGLNVDAGLRGYICLAGEPDDPNAQANARLIAAAPELADMLERSLRFLTSAGIAADLRKDIRAALRKAGRLA